tara:strand:- start:2306 stop:3625 length:1320 start_codon:yes stop_codon:yes gene_type:complete
LFDNLPLLSKEKAFAILTTPIEALDLSSDYYKAVSHLLEYPGNETENILISLLKIKSKRQEVRISQRKALEVLARLNSQKAIPYIVTYLEDKDNYMIENAIWALKELRCNDRFVHSLIANKLEDPTQNRRLIIQTLVELAGDKFLPQIKNLLENLNIINSEYGAAIAAIAKITKTDFRFNDLLKLLQSDNQNLRQTTIQDVIDAGATDLLIPVIKSPVSPYFKLRALEKLYPSAENYDLDRNAFDMLDMIINDNPNNINFPKYYKNKASLELLIDELFHTDFNRSYQSLRKIIQIDSFDIWNSVSLQIERFTKDYGALYFLLNLFHLIPVWPDEAISKIIEITRNSIDSSWPKFIKFRPIAILVLMKYKPENYESYITRYLDVNYTPYWPCRYSCLMGLDIYISLEIKQKLFVHINKLKLDSNRFVSLKAIQVAESISN